MDSPLAVTAVSAFGVHDRQRGSTAGSGVLRSSTPGAGTHLQRPRLGTAHSHSVPDTRELNLTLTGEKIAKTPPAGILSPMPSMVSDQSEKTHSPSLNMRPPTHMRESATSDGFGELTCKEALKHIKRKRERARKQKVKFHGVSQLGEDDVAAGKLARVPMLARTFPAPAAYMPSYIPLSKRRVPPRRYGLGTDVQGPEEENAPQEGPGDEEEFVTLSTSMPLNSRSPDQPESEPNRQAVVNDEPELKENKTDIRQRVMFAIGQVRSTLLRHLLLRYKLIDNYTQLNTMPKENLVSLFANSPQATRELLRGAYLQKSDGSHLVLDEKGVDSFDKYKRFIELEATPRPVSDTFNRVGRCTGLCGDCHNLLTA